MEKKEMNCEKHGWVTHFKRPDAKNAYRCMKCASDSVLRSRKNQVKKAKSYKGDKCYICGYNKCSRALEFHHIDPKTKSFGIGQDGITRSWTRVKEEIDKCVLLCANCHREVHEGITKIPL